MEQRPMIMSPGNLVYQTEWAKTNVKSITELATKLINDPERGARLKKGLCISCYYSSHTVAGQAITSRACMSCGKTQTYSSTATDALCHPCAVDHDLCKKCGGDVYLRTRRKKWPQPTKGE